MQQRQRVLDLRPDQTGRLRWVMVDVGPEPRIAYGRGGGLIDLDERERERQRNELEERRRAVERQARDAEAREEWRRIAEHQQAEAEYWERRRRQ